MSAQDNIIDLSNYRDTSRQAVIDDISAQAFMFLREEAELHDLPIKAVLMEHLMGIAMVVKAVEGRKEAQRVFRDICDQLG
jgi:hypothetical protein